MTGVLRIGNCSGFYGDRLSAMRELLEGTPRVDVLTGDYLAELTMLILGRDRMKDPSLGYARTFVRQAEECLELALDTGVRIVANAGGLNPAGLAERLRDVAGRLGRDVKVAYVDGDDLLPRADELGLTGGGKPLTANAYLGAFGIAAALDAGADVVVTGRVTDASLVVGPAAAHFGWSRTAYDELAGAVVAGHVVECGTQACGGNFSGFLDLPPDGRPIGFPVAEVAADGSSVITKQHGTGGAVTVDTVTAQLMYEVGGPRYLGPDVTARLDSVRLSPDGPDRVRIHGVVGEPPPATAKVCLNELGGFRNTVELVLVGLDIDAKAAWVREQVEAALARHRPATVAWTLARTDHRDADSEEAASCRLRCVVRDADPEVVGRAFTAPVVELGLASYPGFTLTAPPAPAAPYGVYRAGYVAQEAVPHRAVLPDGTAVQIPPPPVVEEAAPVVEEAAPVVEEAEPVVEEAAPVVEEGEPVVEEAAPVVEEGTPVVEEGEPVVEEGEPVVEEGEPLGEPVSKPADRNAGFETVAPLPPQPAEEAEAGFETVAPLPPQPAEATRHVPLGTFVHARSGDKGGDANLGLWVADAAHHSERVAWLLGFVTPEVVRRLVPEAAALDVDVVPLPLLGGVNVVLHGLLGEGVAASTRFDPQAKGLGEWVRARYVDVPEVLL